VLFVKRELQKIRFAREIHPLARTKIRGAANRVLP
jgi:hypothetical protein